MTFFGRIRIRIRTIWSDPTGFGSATLSKTGCHLSSSLLQDIDSMLVMTKLAAKPPKDLTGNLPADQLHQMFPTPPSHEHPNIASPADMADSDLHYGSSVQVRQRLFKYRYIGENLHIIWRLKGGARLSLPSLMPLPRIHRYLGSPPPSSKYNSHATAAPVLRD